MSSAKTAFHYVTSQVCAGWTDSGEGKIMGLLQPAPSEPIEPNGKGYPVFKQVLYELVQQTLVSNITSDQFCDLLKKARPDDGNVSEALADVLWLIGMETDHEAGPSKKGSEEWSRLCSLVKEVVAREIVPPLLLKQVLELELLEGAGLIENLSVMNKKLIRANTKNLYTQQKYNLLREETEGYSKLLSLLHSSLTPSSVKAVGDNVKALIGAFDLDPNRVFDLLLEAYEKQPENRAFLVLSSLFKASALPHLLGFKYQFYQKERPGGEEKTPKSLFTVSALLLAERKLSLQNLLPHLRPSLPEMAKDQRERLELLQKEARGVGVVSLTATAEERKEAIAKANAGKKDSSASFFQSNNQILGLLAGLLSVGSWRVAQELISLLTLHNINPMLDTEVADSLCDLVGGVIEKSYSPLRPICAWTGKDDKETKEKGGKGGRGKRSTPRCSEVLKLEDSVDSVLKGVEPLLSLLGPQISRKIPVFVKLCRLIAFLYRANDASTLQTLNVGDVVMKIFENSLLPGLSLIDCNPAVAAELWEAIKSLGFEDRYRLYSSWKDKAYLSPLLLMAEAETANNTRKILRRLSKENTKTIGRQLAKISHSNPIVVLMTIVSQIEAYDNLINPVVEAFKFLSPLSQDVLSFTLVVHLASSRSKLKEDGTNTSQWLSSLSEFCGVVYRRYPTIELAGLLKYLVERLKAGHSLDLLVLNKLLSRMGGIESFEDISEAQLEGKAGGSTLWLETTSALLTTVNKKAVSRLRDTILKEKLVLPLLALIAQQRASILFLTSTRHLKLLGRLYDTCQMTLVQLLDFLSSTISPSSAYASLLPSLSDLCANYHLEPEVAFHIVRPAIRAADALHAKQQGASGAATDGAGENKELVQKWAPYSSHLLSSISSLYPPPVWEAISAKLFVTFWSLSLYDIYVPHKRYEAEVSRLQQHYTTMDKNPDPSSSNVKRRKDMDKCLTTIHTLKTEQATQVANRKRIMDRFESMKAEFLPSPHNETVLCLLRLCALPRAVLTPDDAVYTAKFFHLLHIVGIPYFSCIQYLDKTFTLVVRTLLCCTEREASNLGLFLRETLQMMNRWTKSKKDYVKECTAGGRPGFCEDFGNPNSKKVEYERFAKVAIRWHRSLVQFFCKSLQSAEYMDIRNSLIVLTKIVEEFPSTTRMEAEIEQKVNKLREEEREDLKVMANRYWALLQKQKPTLRDDGLPPPLPKSQASAAADAPSSSLPPPTGTSSRSNSQSRPPSKSPVRGRSPERGQRERSTEISRSSSAARGGGERGDRDASSLRRSGSRPPEDSPVRSRSPRRADSSQARRSSPAPPTSRSLSSSAARPEAREEKDSSVSSRRSASTSAHERRPGAEGREEERRRATSDQKGSADGAGRGERERDGSRGIARDSARDHPPPRDREKGRDAGAAPAHSSSLPRERGRAEREGEAAVGADKAKERGRERPLSRENPRSSPPPSSSAAGVKVISLNRSESGRGGSGGDAPPGRGERESQSSSSQARKREREQQRERDGMSAGGGTEQAEEPIKVKRRREEAGVTSTAAPPREREGAGLLPSPPTLPQRVPPPLPVRNPEGSRHPPPSSSRPSPLPVPSSRTPPLSSGPSPVAASTPPAPRQRSRKEVIEENRKRLEAEKQRRASERARPLPAQSPPAEGNRGDEPQNKRPKMMPGSGREREGERERGDRTDYPPSSSSSTVNRSGTSSSPHIGGRKDERAPRREEDRRGPAPKGREEPQDRR